MEIDVLLKLWGAWSRGGFEARVSGSLSPIARLMCGVVSGKPCSVVLPVGVVWLNDDNLDDIMVTVERAIARLPRRRREAVRVEFYLAPRASQMEKGAMLSPPVGQSMYCQHLNFALKQLSAMPDVKKLLI
ncbi:hypothetical protein [Wielerella bovis]|uniref:hypothetical protein n=1 Tax=Wielerella bovis TaxID=2917790 RepID=UPI00201A107B|nr:hypothetical protein [Wielerella bovis]ULJ67892.1 hypothetical protein MIS31_04950 [Wielerella bovis]